ncbi:hypothetical protein D4N37_22595 [Pseudomonas protegens]|nr:hypothetical protein D4N37_22595 [Pseudomonas protegens]
MIGCGQQVRGGHRALSAASRLLRDLVEPTTSEGFMPDEKKPAVWAGKDQRSYLRRILGGKS